MKGDILSTYKNPKTNLLARPRVRFEGEEGVGAGPLREFMHLVIKIAEDGIGCSPKPITYFEGEVDCKLPVNNPALRHTGSFRAIGRILGHSFLHGGPSLCGLSKAVKHYFTSKCKMDTSSDPPPLAIKDVPDVELQLLLKEIQDFSTTENVPEDVSANVIPYLLEAGIDVELLSTNREMVVQCLLLYNIIEKRKIELDDMLIGMEVVGLQSFMEKHPKSVHYIFPTFEDADIMADDLKSVMEFNNDESDTNARVKIMFLEYIDTIKIPKKDGADLRALCCFWTGLNILPPRSEKLNVSFDSTSQLQLPMAECCFNNLILPVVHRTFEEFKQNMDIALKHGSKGFTFS